MVEHLGNTDELIVFVRKMNNELVIHKKENVSIRDWSYDHVFNFVLEQFEKRIKIIKNSKSSKVTAKQSIHIANYAMMLNIMAEKSDY